MKKWKTRLLLAALLVIVAANALYWSAKKEGFFGDELYSYHYVNQIDFPYITEDREGEPWANFWHSSAFFQDYLSIGEGEAFDLSGTYRSIQKDVHPPLFYLLLELSCSTFSLVFPGVFSKWCCLLINLAFFVLTLSVLYLLAKRLTQSEALALAACALYGFSVGAVSTVVFLRMYMMYTCFSVLFVYLNALLWERVREEEQARSGFWLYGALSGVTALGVLTHYYFLVYAFFVSGVLWMYALCRRRFHFAIRYAAAMAAGLIASFVFWPNMREDIFKGYRGEQAFDSFAKPMDGSAFWTFFRLIDGAMFGCLGVLFLLFLATAVFAALLGIRWRIGGQFTEEGGICFRMEKKESLQKITFCVRETDLVCFQIVASLFCYVLALAKIAPFREDRYLFNVLPMAAVAAVYLSGRVWEGRRTGLPLALTLAALLLAMAAGYLTTGVNYLYRGTESKLATADLYSHLPAFYIQQGSTFRACGDSIYFAKARYTYPMRADRVQDMPAALEALWELQGEAVGQRSFLLYLDLDHPNQDALLASISDLFRQEMDMKMTPLFQTEYSSVYLFEEE